MSRVASRICPPFAGVLCLVAIALAVGPAPATRPNVLIISDAVGELDGDFIRAPIPTPDGCLVQSPPPVVSRGLFDDMLNALQSLAGFDRRVPRVTIAPCMTLL